MSRESIRLVLSEFNDAELQFLTKARYGTIQKWRRGKSTPRYPHKNRIMKLVPLLEENLL